MRYRRDVDITVDPPCEDPRAAVVRDWLVALAHGDVEAGCAPLADDLVFETSGGVTLHGLDQVRPAIEGMAQLKVTRLHVRHLVAQGDAVAAEGLRVSDEGRAQFAAFVGFAPDSDSVTSVVALRQV